LAAYLLDKRDNHTSSARQLAMFCRFRYSRRVLKQRSPKKPRTARYPFVHQIRSHRTIEKCLNDITTNQLYIRSCIKSEVIEQSKTFLTTTTSSLVLSRTRTLSV
jgi:hypothetical protein